MSSILSNMAGYLLATDAWRMTMNGHSVFFMVCSCACKWKMTEKMTKILKNLENMMEWLLLVGVAPLKHAYDYSIYAGRRNATIFAWEMRMGDRE